MPTLHIRIRKPFLPAYITVVVLCSWVLGLAILLDVLADPTIGEPNVRITSKRYLREEQNELLRMSESTFLAEAVADEAIAVRAAEEDSTCTTTFDREALPREERGLLVFCAPPPLVYLPSAMKSWDYALHGRGRFVVFANDAGTQRVCRENDIPLVCVDNVDEGLPRLDLMFERMHEAQPNGIVGYVNSDITVKNFDPMQKLLGMLTDVELDLMMSENVFEKFQQSGEQSEYWFMVVTRFDISKKGGTQRHSLGGYDFWAWNTKPEGEPLLPFAIPPFRFPYALYDNWILDMAIQSSRRNVIDATNVLDIFHYEHKRVSGSSTWYDALMKGISGVYINRYLGFNEPRNSFETLSLDESPSPKFRHYWKFGTPVEAPYYITVDAFDGFFLSKRSHWSIHSEQVLSNEGCIDIHSNLQYPKCELYVTILNGTRNAEMSASAIPYTNIGAHHRQSKFQRAAEKNWRYTLKEQLKIHATKDGFVMLVAVTYPYRAHLMNFKCSLERVGMSDNLIVAALDDEMYEWGVLQGLPIYSPEFINKMQKSESSSIGRAYGSQSFRSATKLKSRAVLEVLDAGYSVVWSDVDITWFVHPFDALAGYMRINGGIAIQTNSPYVQNPAAPARPHQSVSPVVTDSPAGFRRLNSGLYVAPNNPLVRAAFEEIVGHAAKSSLSEQPSFDAILCGNEFSMRFDSSCLYRPGESIRNATRQAIESWNHPTNMMHVELLNRFRFPNGAILVGEENKNVYLLGKDLFERFTGAPLLAAHNNWIKGEDRKKERQEDAGWWFTDRRHKCKFLAS